MIRRWSLALLLLLAGAATAEAQVDVNHAKVCAQAASPSTSDIDCTDWNADHAFTGGSQGTMLYRDTGEANGANWTTNLLFDETLVNLSLFGGTVGTSGSRVLSIGCASQVDPSTSPADTIQWWCEDLNGAGTAGAVLRTETGGGLRLYDGTDTLEAILGEPTYLQVSRSFVLGTIGTAAIKLASGSLGVYTNFLLGDPDAAVGTSGDKVLLQKLGTCPTNSPADVVQTCVRDRNGASTAELARRNEEGHLESFGAFVHARSTNEATTTGGATDLHTLNTNVSIPTTDGAVIRFAYRKTSGAAASVSVGLKINTTQIIPNTAVTSAATNANESGFCEITVWNRATSHLRALKATCWNNAAAGLTFNLFATADMANAAITDIRITGLSGNAAVTIGVRDVVVQRIAGF